MKFYHRFTQSAPDIEESIHADMAYAVDIIKKQVGDIVSIYISGSFGRGDGMVFMYNNIRIINDYDFLVITKNRQKRERIKAQNILMKKFGFHVSVACIFPDLTNLNLKTQNDVDSVLGSKCLFGDDIFAEKTCDTSFIQKKDAVKLLFSRVRTIFEYYNPNAFENDEIDSIISRVKVAYNIIKANKGVIDSWLIFSGNYNTMDSLVEKQQKINTWIEQHPKFKQDFSLINLSGAENDPVKLALSKQLISKTKVAFSNLHCSINVLDRHIVDTGHKEQGQFGYLFEFYFSPYKHPILYYKLKNKHTHLLATHQHVKKIVEENADIKKILL